MESNQFDLLITSTAFQQEALIPAKYTCEGEGVNPPLRIGNIPYGTQSLSLIATDPDTAHGVFDHWIAWNIPPDQQIAENAVIGIGGSNSAGKTGYHPPCPPSGSHRYYFTVYALDIELSLTAGADKHALEAAMRTHVLAKGSLMGRYEKQQK